MLDDIIEIIEEEPIGVLSIVVVLIVMAAFLSYAFSGVGKPTSTPAIIMDNNTSVTYTAATIEPVIPVYEYLQISPDIGVPAGLKRDINKDSPGAYTGYLSGNCKVAYIDIETWQAFGGKILVVEQGDLPGLTMYTRFGLDTQSRYDENKNVVFSLVSNPWDYELNKEQVKKSYSLIQKPK